MSVFEAVDTESILDRLSWVDGHRATVSVVGFALLLCVGFSMYTIALYRGFWQGGTDFGTYIHMMSTTFSGDGFLQQGKYRANHPGGSYWGAHFSLTVLLYAIPYVLFRSPESFLVFKAVVVASSIVAFWFVICEHFPKTKTGTRLGLAAVVAYGLNPFLWSAWVFDVQEQAFIPLFAFLAYLCYRRGQYFLTTLLFALVALTNEFEVYIVAGFLVGLLVEESGVLEYVRSVVLRRERSSLCYTPQVNALVFSLVAIVFVKVFSAFVIDLFSVSGGIPLKNVADAFRPYVSASGDAGTRASVGGLLRVAVSHPEIPVTSLLAGIPAKVSSLLLFTASTLFLALCSPAALLALIPYLGVAWVLTGIGSYFQFVAHYPFYLLPFVFIGFVRVLATYFSHSPTRRAVSAAEGSGFEFPSRSEYSAFASVFVRILLIVSLIGSASAAGGVFGYRYSTAPSVDADHADVLSAAIDEIPSDASVLTQNTLYPHIAKRSNATFIANSNFGDYRSQYGLPQPKYIFLDYNVSQNFNTRSNRAEQIRHNYRDQIGDKYRVWRWQDNVTIYKRGYRGAPKGLTESYSVPTRVFGAASFLRVSGAFTAGNRSIVARNMVVQPGQQTVWYGPYTTLSPGRYEVTYRVRVGPGSRPGSTVVFNVAGGTNHTTLSQRSVRATDGWSNVTVPLTIDRRLRLVEFRGFAGVSGGDVEMRRVTVDYIAGSERGRNRSRSTARSPEQSQ